MGEIEAWTGKPRVYMRGGRWYCRATKKILCVADTVLKLQLMIGSECGFIRGLIEGKIR